MKKEHIQTGLIIVLILVTLFSVFNINALKREVSSLNVQINMMQDRFSNQIYGIERIVNEMKLNSQWYEAPASPKVTVEEGKPVVNFKVKLTEYSKEDKVTFFVKGFDEETFKAYEANSLDNGIYGLEITEVGPIMPILDYSVHTSTSNEWDYEAEAKGFYDDKIEYYVSVENEGVIKTSETYGLYMHELSFPMFQPLGGMIDVNSTDNVIHVSLDSNRYNAAETYYAINKVTIQAYKDLKLVEFWELSATEPEAYRIEFADTLEITEDYDNLFLEVLYEGKDPNKHVLQRKNLFVK